MMLDYKKLLESLLRELIDKKIISEWYCNGAGYFWKYNEKDERILKLRNEIDDIKANCDLAIEGRDVKIMELEADNRLLEQRGSDILKELLDKNKRCIELEQQIEKMKCCGNCGNERCTSKYRGNSAYHTQTDGYACAENEDWVMRIKENV